MWVRTEEGAINLDDCRSVSVHTDTDESTGATLYVLCALTRSGEHVAIKVCSEVSDANFIRDQIVAQLVLDNHAQMPTL